jgi:anti-sigma factor RsiW
MNERSPTCLTEDDVLGLLDGRLDPVQRTEAERHLDACSECRRLVAESARSDASGEEAPRLGRYVITEVIGAGGMGLVYRAWDPDLRRSVAVKVVARERLAGRAPALLDEARAIASITHPNVIAVHDLSANDELVFFAMELVEGQNLRTWLAERRTWAESAAAFAQAARGLAAIHQAGLVHGDVKPDNILVGSDGRVRVGDFGLAAAEPPPDAPSLPTQDGTPRYLAPERLAGRPASARADQWALGLAIVEAISGGLDGAAVERLRRSGPASVLRGVPRRARPRRALARALASSLAPRPEDRLPSLTDLAAALEARPGGRRRAIGALGVCVAALAIGLALWRVGGADEPRSIARDELRPLDRWCWVERATYDLATTRTFYAALLGWRMDDAPHPRLSVYTTARNATGRSLASTG